MVKLVILIGLTLHFILHLQHHCLVIVLAVKTAWQRLPLLQAVVKIWLQKRWLLLQTTKVLKLQPELHLQTAKNLRQRDQLVHYETANLKMRMTVSTRAR